MSDYYFEIFFENSNGTLFLLPLFTQQENKAEAIRIFKSIQQSILNIEEYTIMNLLSPRLVYSELSKQYFQEKYRINVNGSRVTTMNIQTYDISGFNPDLSMSFEENIRQIVDNGHENVSVRIHDNLFPVKVIRQGINDYQDYIVIQIPVQNP